MAEALATIASLKDAGSSGLRQRKGADSGPSEVDTAKPELQQAIRHGTEGVPIRTVAILCLITFLLAYFFF